MLERKIAGKPRNPARSANVADVLARRSRAWLLSPKRACNSSLLPIRRLNDPTRTANQMMKLRRYLSVLRFMCLVKSKLSSGSSCHRRFIRPRHATFVRDLFQPILVLDVPGHRQSESGGEIILRFPTKLTADFGRVNGIPPIMARAIFYERDQVPRMAAQFRTQFVDQFAD